MTDIAEQLIPALDTIRGDLRNVMVGALANMTKLWRDMPEAEQIQAAHLIDAHAQAIVTRIAVLTATAGRPTVLVNLENLAIGDVARGTFSVSKESASALVPYTKQIVAIMAVGPNQFMGERDKAPIQPDQLGLPMGEPAPARTEAERPTIIIVGRDAAPDGSPSQENATPKPRPRRTPKTKSNGGARASQRKTGSPFA